MDILSYFASGCIIPFMLCDQITCGLNLFLCNNNTYLVISVDLLGLYITSKVIVPLLREYYEVHCLKERKCIHFNCGNFLNQIFVNIIYFQ